MVFHLTNYFLFFFNDTATTEIYTLSLHDALPILLSSAAHIWIISMISRFDFRTMKIPRRGTVLTKREIIDRKSTRLNSSHTVISYAVFCLKKQNPRHYLPGRRGRTHDRSHSRR